MIMRTSCVSRSLGATLRSLWVIIVVGCSRSPFGVRVLGRVFWVILKRDLLVACVRCQCSRRIRVVYQGLTVGWKLDRNLIRAGNEISQDRASIKGSALSSIHPLTNLLTCEEIGVVADLQRQMISHVRERNEGLLLKILVVFQK